MGTISKVGRLAAKVAEEEAERLAARPARRASRAVAKSAAEPERKAPAVIAARAGTARATARDVLHEAANKSKGRPGFTDWRAKNPDNGRVFDTSRLDRVPNVPQTQMDRRVPPRGPSARIQSALADPEVERGINEIVVRGLDMGGREWYNTEPALERLMATYPDPQDARVKYARLMDLVAATSPRSNVTDNIRNASYYNYLMSNDLPIPDKPAGGYGSIAQKSHVEHARNVARDNGWDIYANPKPASFSTNLQGNFQNVTVDTHNFRLPGILSRDPRFLATSVKAGTKGDSAAVRAALASRYPGIPDEALDAASALRKDVDLATYRPQDWVNKGYISMDDAVQDPVLWDTMPRDNEYGFYEQWQQEQARKLGVAPAQYQAGMWLGGGDETGLASQKEPFLSTMEARIRYTADALGEDPEVIAERFLRGEIPLLAKGGRVTASQVAKPCNCE